MATLHLTAENFEETIAKNEIVLVDYYADWCGPCKAFAPIFEQASEANPGIVFAKVDTQAQTELASAFDIRSIPTLMVFREQVLIFAQPGMLPAPALAELIAKVKELDMDEVRKQIAEHEAHHADGHDCAGCGHDHGGVDDPVPPHPK
jgi:thioredoxin 1